MGTPLHRRTEGIGACLADPFANGEGWIELIRSPSPKGAGGGCIDLVTILAQSAARCQSKTCAGSLPIALGGFFACPEPWRNDAMCQQRTTAAARQTLSSHRCASLEPSAIGHIER